MEMTMTTHNIKHQFKNNTKSIMMYAAIFAISFTVFYTPSLVDATHNGCGNDVKYNAAGFLTETGDRWGNEAILKVNSASVCGTEILHTVMLILQMVDSPAEVQKVLIS